MLRLPRVDNTTSLSALPAVATSPATRLMPPNRQGRTQYYFKSSTLTLLSRTPIKLSHLVPRRCLNAVSGITTRAGFLAGSGRKLELPDRLRRVRRPTAPRLQKIAPNCPKIAPNRPNSRPASGMSGVPAKPPDRIRHALQTEIEHCSKHASTRERERIDISVEREKETGAGGASILWNMDIPYFMIF